MEKRRHGSDEGFSHFQAEGSSSVSAALDGGCWNLFIPTINPLLFEQVFNYRPTPPRRQTPPYQVLSWSRRRDCQLPVDDRRASGRGGTWSRQDGIKPPARKKERKKNGFSQQHEPRRTNTERPKTPLQQRSRRAGGGEKNRGCSQSVESNRRCHGNRIPP